MGLEPDKVLADKVPGMTGKAKVLGKMYSLLRNIHERSHDLSITVENQKVPMMYDMLALQHMAQECVILGEHIQSWPSIQS